MDSKPGFSKKNIYSLTALWALSESGLGGFMHALKIPFTGFFLGGFAIVIITLIAHNSSNKAKDILQATLLVVLVKATVSPHSPPMAYIAVAFQGLSGALVLGLIGLKRFAAVLFGMIALFESAIQKFLVMTLIFGKSLWDALDLFFKGILKDLPMFNHFSFSFWLIATYTFVYTAWGMLLGWWASALPKVLNRNASTVLSNYDVLINSTQPKRSDRKMKRAKKMIGAFFMLLFVVTVFMFNGNKTMAAYAFLRTIAALLILFFIVNPIVKWLLAKWVNKKKKEQNNQLSSILDLLPQMRNYLWPAYNIAKQNHAGLAVYKAFVINLVVLALYYKPNEGE